jgi:nitroreductase
LTDPCVHLLLFVHNVTGLPRGLYLFCRHNGDLERLQTDLRPEFVWRSVYPDMPLYLLREADLRAEAIRVSCHQDIAGDSAFAVGMLARFDSVVQSAPYRYRHLFWETGMIGQVLYLEAEAQGLRGTGIGCFFDDAVHRIAGIDNHSWQSLYHFTVGYAVEDPRLSTLPPYAHLTDGWRNAQPVGRG